jgi:hypothetical protein
MSGSLAERIKAAHRGSMRAECASRSRIAALNTFSLNYERIDEFNVQVEGVFQLNLAMSYWRSIDDPTCHGYLVSGLNAEIERRRAAALDTIVASVPTHAAAVIIDTFNDHPEKPATGRDSDAATDLTHTSAQSCVAESVAGHTSSQLPGVWP